MTPNNKRQEILSKASREQAGRDQKHRARVEARPKSGVTLGQRDASQAGQRKPMPPPEQMKGAEQVFYFEIYDESHPEVTGGYDAGGEIERRRPDDSLVRVVKTMVNEAQIRRRDLYSLIDKDNPDAIFRDKNQVYNLEYGLRTRPTITADCAEKWAACLGKRLTISYVDAQQEQSADPILLLEGSN